MKQKTEIAALTAALLALSEVSSASENHKLIEHQPHDHHEAVVDFVTVRIPSGIFSGQIYEFAVIKIHGVDPELFWIAVKPGFRKGSFMKTIEGLSEDDVRSTLTKIGVEEKEITYLILKARANPR